MKPRILVVDDDTALAEMLTIVLRGEGFEPFVVGDGTQALTAVREIRPDLVLLDLMLPGMNGIDVCRVLRADSGVPIVMLTAKTDTVDVVLGLESGADDYIMKPFKPKELVARVRARLRRTEDEPAELLSIADIVIDVPAHKVTREGQLIALTPLEFDLLVALARKPRQVFTREVLLEQVWGYRHAADTRLVNVHVQRLRAKVETDPENPEVVLTVRGSATRPDRRDPILSYAAAYQRNVHAAAAPLQGPEPFARAPVAAFTAAPGRGLDPDAVAGGHHHSRRGADQPDHRSAARGEDHRRDRGDGPCQGRRAGRVGGSRRRYLARDPARRGARGADEP
ncbi:response regulator [Rhodococcus sp. MTM3W5.2]|nr:response regulator [Rhodococcus sp. MTM3W5.2]